MLSASLCFSFSICKNVFHMFHTCLTHVVLYFCFFYKCFLFHNFVLHFVLHVAFHYSQLYLYIYIEIFSNLFTFLQFGNVLKVFTICLHLDTLNTFVHLYLRCVYIFLILLHV